jgi:outer membrane protein assembly factor BamB
MDAANGRVLWSLQAPSPTCPRVAAADLDNRKGDELLYVASNRLIVITGDRTTGRVLWEWEGPGQLSMPVIADVDEDGLAEVVLVSADGQVLCLDGSR